MARTGSDVDYMVFLDDNSTPDLPYMYQASLELPPAPSIDMFNNNMDVSLPIGGERSLDTDLIAQLFPDIVAQTTTTNGTAPTTMPPPPPPSPFEPAAAATQQQQQQPVLGFNPNPIVEHQPLQTINSRWNVLPFNANDDFLPDIPSMDFFGGNTTQKAGDVWIEKSLLAAIEAEEADLDVALLSKLPPPLILTPATLSGASADGAVLGAAQTSSGGLQGGVGGEGSSGAAAPVKLRGNHSADYNDEEYREDDVDEEELEEEEDDDDDDEEFGHSSKRRAGGRSRSRKQTTTAGGGGGKKGTQQPRSGSTARSHSTGRGGLTKSQEQVLKNREAQKRFREKQKLLKKETELKIELLSEQLQQEEKSRAEEARQGELLTKMIACREDQLARLQANLKQLEDTDTLCRESILIDPYRLDLMYRLTPPGLYTYDQLLRYQPAGHQGHLGEDGRAKEPAPLDHLLLEWNRFVLSAKKLMDNAAKAAQSSRHFKPTKAAQDLVMWVHEKTAYCPLAAALIQQPEFDGDVMLESAGVKYKFSRQSLLDLTDLLYRFGQLNWQQVCYFPRTMLRIASTNATTGHLAPSEVLEDLNRWQNVLKALGLSREQLLKIANAHKNFVYQMAPLKMERPRIMEQLGVAAASGDLAALDTATLALQTNSRKEFAEWVEMAARLRATLLYPIQLTRLFTLSWPYWPQQNILGTAAELLLGLEPAWSDPNVSLMLRPTSSESAG